MCVLKAIYVTEYLWAFEAMCVSGVVEVLCMTVCMYFKLCLRLCVCVSVRLYT